MFISLGVLLASSLLGARFVAASKFLAHAQTVQPTHFFRSLESRGSSLVDFEVIDETWYPTERTRSSTQTFLGTPDPNSDWLYLHTSGTTGRPKFIALSERMVRDRTLAVAADFPFRKTTLATTFKCTSRPFFARALGTLCNAGSIIDSMDLDFWIKCGVNLVCGAPGQIAKLLSGRAVRPRLPLLEASGARLSSESAKEYLQSFAQVVDVYGAGETNKTFANVNSLGPEGQLVIGGRRLDSELQIVSPDGALCRVGEIGTVRVRNSYTVSGYLNAPEQTARVFRDGWFYPGDLATWGDNGELIMVSREDDVINIGGYKINAPMLDMLFSSVQGIREAIVFNNPKPDAEDRILAFAVFESGADRVKSVTELCNLVHAKTGITVSPLCIRSIDKIPRMESGDPDRRTCENMVRQRAGVLQRSE